MSLSVALHGKLRQVGVQNARLHGARPHHVQVDAGAVVFGKTNMPLFGADIQSTNDVYGQTNNPWDRQRTPSICRR